MTESLLDLLRAGHLLFFALGMGGALMIDIRTLMRFGRVLDHRDIQEFVWGHNFVLSAVGGLWVTGLALIWARTGFDLAQFSPKLWAKLAVVVLLTVNAFFIGASIMPQIKQLEGRSLATLSTAQIRPLVAAATLSFFCWIGGLALGSSAVLKVASASIIESALAALLCLVVAGSLSTFAILRHLHDSRPERDCPFTRLAQSAQSDPQPTLVWGAARNVTAK